MEVTKTAGFRIRGKSMDEALAMVKAAVKLIWASQQQLQLLRQSLKTQQTFPGLVVRPQTSIPKPSPGGEDLLLQDFRNRDKQ